jgi:hypothetical protein
MERKIMAKKASTYLKMQVLGAVEAAPGESNYARIKHVAGLVFEDECGQKRQFTWRTIQTWYSTFKKHGLFYNEIRKRSDKGSFRKCSPEELMEAINQALLHFRKGEFDKMQIYRWIVEKGVISRNRLAQTTFYRFVREYELLKDDDGDNKKRLAFAMRFANELWQGDTLIGPYTNTPDGKKQAKLIAFLDDASRVLVHGEFFICEDTPALVKTMRSAFYKRGVPERIYVDNGKIYCGNEITSICARVGTLLCHTPVRDGAAKGKIERFFRTVRTQFLVRELDLSSLAALNRQLQSWVEDEYNCRVHSVLGLKPIDRFNQDIRRINFLPTLPHNDELFFAEDERKVKKDNTFSFKNRRYEAPADVRDSKITVRYDRMSPERVIVYKKDERLGEAELLDPIYNSQRWTRDDHNCEEAAC